MAAAFLCRRSATRLNWVIRVNHCQGVARPSTRYSVKQSLIDISRPSVGWESPYWWPAMAISNKHRLLNTESGRQPVDDKTARQPEDEMHETQVSYSLNYLSQLFLSIFSPRD